MTKKKNLVSPGQPTKYKPEYCQRLIEHMEKGFSYETFGADLNVSKQTVYDWEIHPEFLDAKRRAFAKCQQWWEEKAAEYLVSEPKGATLNTGVWIFNMKNRFRWTDRVEQNTNANVKVEDFKSLIDEFKELLSNKASERTKK